MVSDYIVGSNLWANMKRIDTLCLRVKENFESILFTNKKPISNATISLMKSSIWLRMNTGDMLNPYKSNPVVFLMMEKIKMESIVNTHADEQKEKSTQGGARI